MPLVHAVVAPGAIFVASSHYLMLFLFEDIAQVLLKLSYLILLVEDFLLENYVLVLHLGFRAHLPVPLLHRVHDLVTSVHACMRDTIVRWCVIELASPSSHGA